jgi:hypothetical protein
VGSKASIPLTYIHVFTELEQVRCPIHHRNRLLRLHPHQRLHPLTGQQSRGHNLLHRRRMDKSLQFIQFNRQTRRRRLADSFPSSSTQIKLANLKKPFSVYVLPIQRSDIMKGMSLEVRPLGNPWLTMKNLQICLITRMTCIKLLRRHRKVQPLLHSLESPSRPKFHPDHRFYLARKGTM